MAKIHEEDVVIRISKIIRDDEDNGESVITTEICTTLEAVAGELFAGYIVEVTKLEKN